MSARAVPPAAEAMERSPRAVLRWSGVLLLIGLGLVGTGAADEGAPLALAGLLIIIYGIHRYGRLGPDDETGIDEAARAIDLLWIGGLAAFAGAAVVVGARFAEAEHGKHVDVTVAWLVLMAGVGQMYRGHVARPKAPAPAPKKR